MASLAALLPRIVLLAALGPASALSASAQSAAASVEGRAVDAGGAPIRNAVVRLVADPSAHTSAHAWRYTLLADRLGKFSQGGLAPGAYLVMVYSGDKAETVWRSVSLSAGTRTQLELRPSQQPDMPSPQATGSMMRVSSRTSARAR